jgi:Arm DNA-binding domain
MVEGLYVRVSVHGTKTFVYRQRAGGVARYMTVGEYPQIGLAEARAKVSELQNIPLGERTVKSAVEAYLAHVEGEYLRPEQVRRRLEGDVTRTLAG